jgi:hypothetical protein
MAGAATGSGYGRQGFEADLPPATRRALLDLRRQIATATAAAASGGAGLGAYASFYLSTGGLTAAAGTALTLVLNQTDVNSDGTKYSLASNEVTVTDAGDYEISYHVSFNSGGTSRSEYNVWVEADTVEIPGTRSANYQRGYDSGSTSAATFITTLAASDVLRLRVQRTDGAATTGYQDDNGTRLTIKKLG